MTDGERYRPEYDYLSICPTCFHLFEEGRPDGQEQRCRCRHCEETRWEGFDYNCRAILCRCCALVPLRSGSRWSPYFCRECQLLAMGVSVWERRLIFPIGPHSIMHGFVPDTVAAIPGSEPDPPFEGLERTVSALMSGYEVLEQWYQMAVPWRLNALGLRAPISLRDYAEVVEERDWSVLSHKTDAFEELCLFTRTGTTMLTRESHF